jgi:hypothetical protein
MDAWAVAFDAHRCADLAALLATCPDASVRNGNQAVDFARHACELTEWKLPYCLVTLAAAYAESGDFPQAVKYQKHVLTMRPWTDSERDEIQAHLDLYQQGKPFHEVPSHYCPIQCAQFLPTAFPLASRHSLQPANRAFHRRPSGFCCHLECKFP